MKTLAAILISITVSMSWAGAPMTVQGEVLEVKDVESYTYLRLKTTNGETWAAVSRAPLKKGAMVKIDNVIEMRDFESKSLKTTFKSILFGRLDGAGGSAQAGPHGTDATHPTTTESTNPGTIHVAKAIGANAWTVAEIIAKGGELRDKPILVRGKIVKYNPGIMGKNWIHLRDGSGSAADNTNDIVVTTLGEATTGDVMTVRGIVRTDRDFGSGYSYKLLIEDATLQK